MDLLDAISVSMAFLGMGLCLFVGVLLYPQRRIRPAGLPAWLMVSAFGVWHLASFFSAFFAMSMGHAIPYSGLWRAAGFAALTVALTCSAWLMVLAHRMRERGFQIVFGVSVLLAVLPLPAAYSTIGPAFFLAWFVYWYHTFGLLLSRRSIFALTLGVSAAVYLFVVRALAAYLEDEFHAIGWLVELPLLFWAGILWLPLYAWISNFLNKRAKVYSEFGKTVIQEASLVLELPKRLQFLARELASRFELKQVIITAGAGAGGPLPDADRLDLERFAQSRSGDVFYVPRMDECAATEALRRLGCNYLFPLRYDKGLSGLLLVDTSPLAFLDENETVLLALAPQISQSIEACRLVEEKIGLERELSRQENLASLGNVAATIAHEVKNPLSAIKTITQVMREDESVNARYAEDLAFIVSEVDRLDQSVRQLLGLSRPAPALDQEVDLSALVQATATALGRQARPAGIRVDARIAEGVRRTHSNSEMLQQIVFNLILNAIQASREGQTVKVTLQPDGRLVIEDEGPGIPEALRERVFEPFFTTKVKGTGLGLSIVRKNARMMGGDVTIESAGASGTRVVVILET